MISWLVWDQAAPWLMFPLLIESFLLVAVIAFAASAHFFNPEWIASTNGKDSCAKMLLDFLFGSAPMFGLFGTVVGLTMAFGQLGLGGGEQIGKALASQLYTTAYGLCVAIPAYTVSVLYPWRRSEGSACNEQ